MVSARAQFDAMASVFAKPTLSLLHDPRAQQVAACLRVAFSASDGSAVASVSSPRMHRAVSDCLVELTEHGVDVGGPGTDGAASCRRWIGKGWLHLDNAASGDGQVYTLTAAARAALSFVAANEEDALAATGSRVRVIQSQIVGLARRARPDRDERIADLEAEVADRIAEVGRLQAGGALQVIGADELRSDISLLHHLSVDLGNDCVRLGELLDERRRVIGRAVSSTMRPGELLDSYLDPITALLDDTIEGQLFAEVLDLYRNEVDVDRLRDALDVLLAAPVVRGLGFLEQARLRAVVDELPDFVEPVIKARSRSVAALRTQMRRLTGSELAVDTLLEQVEVALGAWLTGSTSHSKVDLGIRPPALSLDQLPDAFASFVEVEPPPPVRDAAHRPDLPDFEALWALGGPSLDELREVLETELARAASQASAGEGDGFVELDEVFNALPSALRRPVEIAGLVGLVSDVDRLSDDAETRSLTTADRDGSERVFWLPRIVLDATSASSGPTTPGRGAR